MVGRVFIYTYFQVFSFILFPALGNKPENPERGETKPIAIALELWDLSIINV